MSINSSRLYQLFKYAVYAFLTLNIYLFYAEEAAAAPLQFPDGVNLGNFREAYAATIDTLAWVILLLMFELETYVLEDRHFTPAVVLTLRGLRALAYGAILMAFSGYYDDLMFVREAAPFAAAGGLCALPAGDWSWAVTFGEYVPIAADNCGTLATSANLIQFGDLPLLVDEPGWVEIVRLGWADVINAAVWILVVIILEVDVWLQERQRYEGLILLASNAFKFLLYSTLLLVAIYWTFKGDFLDTFDAYMWLIAFVFIELNVFEWHEEDKAARTAQSAPGSR